MFLKTVDVRKISGNKDIILSNEPITGPLEFVPLSDGTGLIMLPVDVLIEHNTRAAERGLLEIAPMSRADLHLRKILSVSKKEAMEILCADLGKQIGLIRKGWGQTFKHVVEIAGD